MTTMDKLNFFTSVKYNNPDKSFSDYLLEKVDNYFYLGGRKAIWLGRKDGVEEVFLAKVNSSKLMSVAKIVSYFTVVIPLIMLLVKACLRSTHNFKVIDKPENNYSKLMDLLKPKGPREDPIESAKKLQEFYQRNGIIGNEPIQVDMESLGLNLDEEAQYEKFIGYTDNEWKYETVTVTLRKVTEETIAEINECIKNNSDKISIKDKRKVCLGMHPEDPLKSYRYLGNPSTTNEWEDKDLWLKRIVQALIDKKHIFKLDEIDGNGYHIQA